MARRRVPDRRDKTANGGRTELRVCALAAFHFSHAPTPSLPIRWANLHRRPAKAGRDRYLRWSETRDATLTISRRASQWRRTQCSRTHTRWVWPLRFLKARRKSDRSWKLPRPFRPATQKKLPIAEFQIRRRRRRFSARAQDVDSMGDSQIRDL